MLATIQGGLTTNDSEHFFTEFKKLHNEESTEIRQNASRFYAIVDSDLKSIQFLPFEPDVLGQIFACMELLKIKSTDENEFKEVIWFLFQNNPLGFFAFLFRVFDDTKLINEFYKKFYAAGDLNDMFILMPNTLSEVDSALMSIRQFIQKNRGDLSNAQKQIVLKVAKNTFIYSRDNLDYQNESAMLMIIQEID